MKGIKKISPFILVTISLCLCISCEKEKGFTISGQITGIADSTMVNLQNISTGEYLDSSWVVNGHFTFKGQLTNVPEELRIISGLKAIEKGILFYTDLLMGNEDAQVHGDISDLPQIGDEYYDFEAINVKGILSKLSETGDQYILLQFAGTGCYGSNLAVQKIKTIYEKYKDAVSFVSYFIDDKKATWLSTTEKDSIIWLSLWNEGGKYNEVYNKYGLTGTPTFFLISPDKQVISSWFGYEEGMIEKEIHKAFEQQEE